MTKTNSILKRLEKLEAVHGPQKVYVYTQDLDNPDLFREGVERDGPTFTQEQIDAAHGKDDIIILVTYHREKREC